jgi:di/tricarboxylate transporter
VSVATITLLALLAAILLSMVSKLNIGLIAIGLAWIIGVYVAGGKPDSVMAGFPVDLFLTLSGVCFLFAIAELNGTFPALAQRVMGGTARSRVAIPLSFFGSAMAISAVGPGAIASTALIVPIAAAIGRRAHIPPMLTALMVANGANAGNLSPISAVGVIANSRMDAAGLGGHELAVMVANLLAHVLVSLIAWAWFLPKLRGANAAPEIADDSIVSSEFTRAHIITLSILAVWIAGVVLFKANLAFSAFAAGVALILLRVGEEKAAISRMPWGILLMVCGVATLVALVQAQWRDRIVQRTDRACRRPGVGLRRHRFHHGIDFHLQQHFGCGFAGISSDGAQPRQCNRCHGPAGHRALDQRGFVFG